MRIETAELLLKTARQIIDATRAERDALKAKLAEAEVFVSEGVKPHREHCEVKRWKDKRGFGPDPVCGCANVDDISAEVRALTAERDRALELRDSARAQAESFLAQREALQVRVAELEALVPQDFVAEAFWVRQMEDGDYEVIEVAPPGSENFVRCYTPAEIVKLRDAVTAALTVTLSPAPAVTPITCPCTVCACPTPIAPWESGEVCWHCQDGLHGAVPVPAPVRLPAPEDAHGVPTERP